MIDQYFVSVSKTDLPSLVKDLPMETARTIINLMNYMEVENNWEKFAMRVWPKMTIVDSRFFEDHGKMKGILERWGNEGGTTKELLSVLRDMDRMDVLAELKKQYPSLTD
jgi:hypothetical protein